MGTLVPAASACLRLIRLAQGRHIPGCILQTTGLHMRPLAAPQFVSDKVGFPVAAAAATAILKCLPYELPSVAASVLDHDPSVAGLHHTHKGPGSSTRPTIDSSRPGIWAHAFTGRAGVAASSDLFGVAQQGGALQVPRMTYSSSGAFADTAANEVVPTPVYQGNRQHIITGTPPCSSHACALRLDKHLSKDCIFGDTRFAFF
jgi:hypothetical protein